MSDDVTNALRLLLLIDRLAALIQSIGARVRDAQAAGRPITAADLDEQHRAVSDAIAEARNDIAAAKAAGR